MPDIFNTCNHIFTINLSDWTVLHNSGQLVINIREDPELTQDKSASRGSKIVALQMAVKLK